MNDDLRDVPGVLVGHWTDERALTGCTVVLVEQGAVAAVDVRGAAPGTRETDLLGPGRTIDRVQGILLTGGSAFGLAAADGVMAWLRERGRGFPAPAGPVPIVPAAVIYDLAVGESVAPDARAGAAACDDAQAQRSAALLQGNVGAGTGATVGKLRGREAATRGGLGSASTRAIIDGRAITVGAIVAVNAFGDVRDPQSGAIIAGARDGEGWLDTFAAVRHATTLSPEQMPQEGTNTTIAVVATDAPLDWSGCYRLAQNAHDALARTIWPCHTPFDGDTIFALSTTPGASDSRALAALSVLAEETLARAVVRAATA